MKIGAWYDSSSDELRIRLRGATRGEHETTLKALSGVLQTLPLAELRAMGQAIQATLEDELTRATSYDNHTTSLPDAIVVAGC